MILVIDNYDSFTWNLVHYLEEAGGRTHVVRNDQLSVSEALDLSPEGIVLSPGPRTPNEAGICVDLIRATPAEVPILGVCLGHQSIGQAYGGNIVMATQIRHGKLSRIEHDGTGIFSDLPDDLTVTRYHSLAISVTSLPDRLRVTARTPDGEIMGIVHDDRPVHGLQFHPESIRTDSGKAMIRNFVRIVEEHS